jgi:hypothetical protein
MGLGTTASFAAGDDAILLDLRGLVSAELFASTGFLLFPDAWYSITRNRRDLA